MARVRYMAACVIRHQNGVCVCALEVRGHHVTRPTVEWTKVWPVYISKLDNAKLSRCTFFTQTH